MHTTIDSRRFEQVNIDQTITPSRFIELVSKQGEPCRSWRSHFFYLGDDSVMCTSQGELPIKPRHGTVLETFRVGNCGLIGEAPDRGSPLL